MGHGACLYVDGCVVRGGRKLYCVHNLRLGCRGIVAVVGGNGSGKTTLLKTLAGLASCVRGTFWAAKPLLYMPEEHFTPPSVKVREWLWLHNVDLERALKAGLVHEILDKRVYKLSHGWRRLLELVAVTLSYVRVYMLDEPFAGIDEDRLADAWRLVEEAGRRGLVLLTAHSMESLRGRVDKSMIIDKGEARIIEAW